MFLCHNHLLRSRLEEILDSAAGLSKVGSLTWPSPLQWSDCLRSLAKELYCCTTAICAFRELSFGDDSQLRENCLCIMSELRFEPKSLFTQSETPDVGLWNPKLSL